MLPHDLIAQGKSHAGALALGCEVRVEDAIANTFRNSRAGIDHANAHERPGRRVLSSGPHRQSPAVGHGFHRVYKQIEQHLQMFVDTRMLVQQVFQLR